MNPAECYNEWQEWFNSPRDYFIMMCHKVILLGDFNIDLLKPKPKWIQIYTMHGLEQLIDQPACIMDQTETLIDHICVTSKQYITKVCVPDYATSDHYPICLTWYNNRRKIPKIGHKEINYRCFSKFSEQDFFFGLKNSGLENVYQIRNPDEADQNLFFCVQQACAILK